MESTEAATDCPHLLVVDDDERLRALLQRYLSGSGFRVTAAADASEARALIKSLTFDALVLDVMMPGESGFDLAESLRAHSDVPILMLTARGEPGDRIEGLERGADDYLGKPFEPRELMLRLSALLRRTRGPDRAPLRQVRMGANVFDLERGELRRGGKIVRLTGSEAQLLKVLAANAGHSFSRSTLCSKLDIALERSVDVQVTRLRRKIEDDPKLPLYIQTVRGVGYVLVPDSVE
ncbi:MAG TPA: response regulator [Candidatus Binatia bacterium]|jgi:two-component system phosphate regulon response regulator OmpR